MTLQNLMFSHINLVVNATQITVTFRRESGHMALRADWLDAALHVIRTGLTGLVLFLFDCI